MTQASHISRSALLHYALLAFPIAFAGMPLYVYAPDFYATQYGLSLTLIGSILLMLRLIDAVQDPLIGHLSDKHSRHRLPIMAVAAIALALSFYALFMPPQTDSIIMWFAICIFIATTSFSVLAINLNTLGGLWSDNKDDKTRIASFREAIGLIGLLFAVSLPAILHISMPATKSFAWLSGTLAIVMIIALTMFTKWVKQHAAAISTTTSPTLSFKAFAETLKGANRRLFIIYALSMLGSSFPAVLLLFFVRDLLGAEELTGLFLTLYFLSGAAAMPLWNIVSRIWGKQHAWLAAMLIAVISFIWVCGLSSGDIVAYAIICIISGIALGADLALPPSMLSDNIDKNNQRHMASLQFSLLTFLSKVALAVASIAAFSLLDSAGFVAAAENNKDSLSMLSLTYGLIPCLFKLLAAAFLWRSIILKKQEVINEKNTNNHSNRSDYHV